MLRTRPKSRNIEHEHLVLVTGEKECNNERMIVAHYEEFSAEINGIEKVRNLEPNHVKDDKGNICWRKITVLFRSHGFRRMVLMCILLAIMFGKRIVQELSDVERHFPNPFQRARIFNLFRYWQALYLDRPRPRHANIRNFTLSRGNAYVINMNRDQARLRSFYRINGKIAEQSIERYPAYTWERFPRQAIVRNLRNASLIPSDGQPKEFNNSMARQQKQYASDYPFVRLSTHSGRYGDAGCFLSHVLLIQEKLLNQPNVDHIFVFEDDVRIKHPQTYKILAPGEADIVFLSPQYARKRVVVPWEDDYAEESHKHVRTRSSWSSTSSQIKRRSSRKTSRSIERNWNLPPTHHQATVRVIGGAGAIGYIVTRRGAEKLMRIARRTKEPLDLSFFTFANLHVYLPLNSYDLVWHLSGNTSVRRDQNA